MRRGPVINLSFGFVFEDLYTRDGLLRLQDAFHGFISENNENVQTSDIVELAPLLEEFIGYLFGIMPELTTLKQSHNDLSLVPLIRRNFVQRVALKKYPVLLDVAPLSPFSSDDDLGCARELATWLQDPKVFVDQIAQAEMYAAYRTLVNETDPYATSQLFKRPQKINPNDLLKFTDRDKNSLSKHQLRHRSGFDLTDPGKDRAYSVGEASYCIHCHHQGKDSCATGLPANKEKPLKFDTNALGIELTGCPLDEKISEMNQLKSQGIPIGALAAAMIDNPLLAATGHRICNDCSKACIFQKQDPVDIPAIETQTLNDVLDLPWGFEIYSLLSRWNPLNFERPVPLPESGKRVLVVGMGPAGFTLAHHLLNDGHTVVGIDGLKIESLPSDQMFSPIKDWRALHEPLSTRIASGFGGVAEYGITVRWDKNYLKLIRLLLERRSHFLLKGGVRFGGTLRSDQAFSMGFDHIALCMGAGSPSMLGIENELAQGVRHASDFLMALQLTGAHRADSLANMQIRMPIVVIGGGLTAIDTATEAMAYYPVQVQKFKARYDELIQTYGADVVHKNWTAYDYEVTAEFLAHADLFQSGVQKAMKSLGGVTVVYRSDVQKSPSYRMNHEEVAKALEEGIVFMDNVMPIKINTNSMDQAQSVDCVDTANGSLMTVPAKTVLVAAGTKPNVNITYDESFPLTDRDMFVAADEHGHTVNPEKSAKPENAHILMNDNRFSFFGDLHPSFRGNVVKAMASAKRGYPIVTKVLSAIKSCPISNEIFLRDLNEQLTATVHLVNILNDFCVELVIRAPLAAKNFKPGHLFRLQNFETLAPVKHGTRLAMEGLALNGISADPKKGLVKAIVYEAGASSMLCRHLKVGEPVIFMGPTGTDIPIPTNETILLIATGLNTAVLWAIGKAMRAKGCLVIILACFKNAHDRFRPHEIEEAADTVIWCYRPTEESKNNDCRPNDFVFYGDLVDALIHYASKIAIHDVRHVLVHGTNSLNHTIIEALKNKWVSLFCKGTTIEGSVNAPMQCMMKGICAQCLQVHHDPETGISRMIYSCANPHQPIQTADYTHLNGRLTQNALSEKIARLWTKHCLSYED